MHIPTLFLVIIVTGFCLAPVVALMSTRWSRGLWLWSAALVLHSLGFVLIGLRGQIPDAVSVVLANALLASAAALFSQGVFRFQQRPAPRVWIWLPVVLLCLVLGLLLDDLKARVLAVSAVLSLQGLLALGALWQKRRQTVGRGQYILWVGFMLITVIAAVRFIAVLAEWVVVLSLYDNNSVQAAIFLASLLCLVLLSFGIVTMYKERTEQALQRSQNLSQAVLDAVPSHIAVLDKKGVIAATNRTWQAFLQDCHQASLQGLAAGVGDPYPDFVDDGALLTPGGNVRAGISSVLQGQQPSFVFEYACAEPEDPRWFMMSVSPMGGDAGGAVVVHTDITKRKRSERYESFRSQVLEMLANAEPLDRILEGIVRGIEQIHPRMLCSLLLLSPDGRTLGKGIAPRLPQFYNDALEGIRIGPGQGSCGTAAFTGQRVVVEDIAAHPYWKPFRELAERAGLGACWSQPVLSSDNRVLGTFAVYHRQPQAPEPSDIAVIEQAARLVSIAIERSNEAQKLSASESMYRMLTENISEIVWREDAKGRISYISPADERIRGFRAEEVVGHPAQDILTEEGVAIFTAARSQGLDAFTAPVRCKDGSTRWVDVSSTVERDGQGAIVGYHGISRDVTERVRVEALLKASEERYRQLVNKANEGICVIQNQLLRFANPKLQAMFGYSENDWFGKSFVQFIHLDDRALVLAAYQRRMQGDTEFRYQARVLTKSQGTRWVEISGTTIEWQGQPATLNFLTDVTERRELEEQIRKLAYHDALTLLPNRRLFSDRLHQEMASQQHNATRGALLFLDLDHFKPLNDLHGHKVGDLLLVEVAERLSRSVRAMDTVARFGGDEFVVMLSALSGDLGQATAQALGVAEKIRLSLSATYLLTVQHEGKDTPEMVEHHCSASIGVVMFQGVGVPEEELLRQADIAMYRAKEAGGNAVCQADH